MNSGLLYVSFGWVGVGVVCTIPFLLPVYHIGRVYGIDAPDESGMIVKNNVRLVPKTILEHSISGLGVMPWCVPILGPFAVIPSVVLFSASIVGAVLQPFGF